MKNGIFKKMYVSIGWILLAIAVIVVAVVVFLNMSSDSNIEWGEPDAEGNRIGYEYYTNGSVREYRLQNADGNTVQMIYYNEDGSIKYSCDVEYDENGNRTLEILKENYNSEGVAKHVSELYEFDNKGRWTKSKSFYYGFDGTLESVFESERVYSRNTVSSRWIRKTEYYRDGTVRSETLYGYPDSNRPIKAVYYSHEGFVERDCEYDDNGNVIKDIFYDTDGSVTHWMEYEHDSEGMVTLQKDYDADGKLTGYTEYSNTEEGNRVLKTYDADGKFIDYLEYEYISDAEGNPTFDNLYRMDGDKRYLAQSIEYQAVGDGWIPKTETQYNSNGEIIRQVEFDENGSVKSFVEQYDGTKYENAESIPAN